MNTYIKILIAALGTFSTFSLMAQAAPPATPIDGGLSLLLAGGAAYGIKKLKDSRDRN